jgi:hypothetical protein
MLDSAAVGAIIGFLGRAGPELLKFWDRHLERQHELAMQDKALAFEEKSPGRMREKSAVDGGDLQAVFNLMREAYSQQFQPATPYDWLNALLVAISTMVRPGATAALLFLYVGVKISIMVGWFLGGAPLASVDKLFDNNDFAVLSGILTFWFLDRQMAKTGGVGK